MTFRAADAEAEILDLLEARIARLDGEKRERDRKAALAAILPFPFDAPRPIQQELMAAIRGAVAASRHLLAQAPTGSGKTAAALHAALSEALRGGKKLVFLTAKTLQQTLVVETLRRIDAGGFHVLWMRSKEKMCANDRVICHEEHCAYAFDYPAKMERSGKPSRIHFSNRDTQVSDTPSTSATAFWVRRRSSLSACWMTTAACEYS